MSINTTWSKTAEAELIALAKQGERKAINELFEHHYPSSLNVALRILRSVADAEDAVQGAYCAALQKLDSFRGDASFGTWINRIVINQCLQFLRSSWRRRRASDAGSPELEFIASVPATTPSPEASAWRQEVADAVNGALLRLSPPLRSVFSLYSRQNMQLGEVADAMGLTLAATKTRIHRARRAMRTTLRPVWSESSTGQRMRSRPAA